MTHDHDRLVGDDLTPHENAILDLLCSGDDAPSASVRAQRATATWGGHEHEDCECFLILVDADGPHPCIAHDGGPFSMAEVSDGVETLGLLELWVVDGHLHSVNYMPFGGDHVALPSPDDFRITVIERD